MSGQPGHHVSKELSTRTWPDFERLFSQGGGWDSCGCMLYQRGCHLSRKEFHTRAEQRPQNLLEKRELVEQRKAHGILVYADGEPVGWCQYGPVSELPIAHRPRQSPGVLAHDPTSQWRITCFVTLKTHRRQGVAGTGLAAALVAIGTRGGGWVEGLPIALVQSKDDLRRRIRVQGPDSEEVEQYLKAWPKIVVRGVGPVPAVAGSFGNVSHSGTVSMFSQHGFEAVRVVRETRVLMRRQIPAADGPR